MQTWLNESEYALLRCFVRNSKQDPLSDEVKILEVNPTYAHIEFPDGREFTVINIGDLAPAGVHFQTTDNPHTINKPSNPPGVMVPECVASPSESENNSPFILDDQAQSPVGSNNLVVRQ